MAKAEFPRKGAWTVVAGAVGIIAELPYVERTTREEPDPEDETQTIRVPVTRTHWDKAEVHFVNDKGETKTVEVVALDALTMAKYGDIPEPRREAHRLKALGYEDVPDVDVQAHAAREQTAIAEHTRKAMEGTGTPPVAKRAKR